MNPIQPSRAMNIKIEIAGQSPKQLEKNVKGLNDGERKYLQNILKNVNQPVDSNIEVNIAKKLHLYTIKSQNEPQMSKMNKIMANFKGERTSSREMTKAIKSWENHLGTSEIFEMSKKMNEVRKDSFGRNLRDRRFSSATNGPTVSHLLRLGLQPGASLEDAVEAYKKAYGNFKAGPQDANSKKELDKKFGALSDLHMAYDNYHAESCFEYAKTTPPRPLPLPPLKYRPLNLEEKALFEKFGIKENATSSEIRAALKKPMIDAHPDRGGSTEAMQEIVNGPLEIGQMRQREEGVYQGKVAANNANPLAILGITPGQSRAEVLTAYRKKTTHNVSLTRQEGIELREAMGKLDRLYEDRINKDLRSRLNT
jgi:hypothetical protein